jgi:uncharacterized protein YkwD
LDMTCLRQSLVLCVALVAPVLPAQRLLSDAASPAALATDARLGSTQAVRAREEQLFELANEARAAQGIAPLEWDPALASAALTHCLRMAAEGPISHRYGGEPELAERAGHAGAHFSLVEENVAMGPSTATIHQGWMHSPGHRANLLNRQVDRIGVAVVASRSGLYAVADFAHSVPVLSQAQVEATIAHRLRVIGVSVRGNPTGARDACAQDSGFPASLDKRRPEFIMRWQEADLTRLPQPLVDRIASGNYTEAAVGSCPAHSAQGAFTAYRVAVVLFGASSSRSNDFLSAK